MKTLIALSLTVLSAVVGCDKADNNGSNPREQAPREVNAPVDNTKQNVRDRAGTTVMPSDQGENDVDRTITQKIRQSVVKDSSMSMTAKNIKIITNNGAVTLRGPVKTEKEKTDIGAIAQSVDGVRQLDNQLEITN